MLRKKRRWRWIQRRNFSKGGLPFSASPMISHMKEKIKQPLEILTKLFPICMYLSSIHLHKEENSRKRGFWGCNWYLAREIKRPVSWWRPGTQPEVSSHGDLCISLVFFLIYRSELQFYSWSLYCVVILEGFCLVWTKMKSFCGEFHQCLVANVALWEEESWVFFF